MVERPGRPARLVVVGGTGTEVGKTWVGCRLLTRLIADGVRVAVRKPVQSHEPGDRTTDADQLAAATGEDALVICPPHRRYDVPMAPPMAAEVLGLPAFTVAELAWEIASSWPPGGIVDLGLVELVGGTRSPLTADGDGVDLIRAIDPDVVVIVADAGLGTIHSVRSTLDASRARAHEMAHEIVVHLNRYDDAIDLHRRNRAWLVDVDGLVVTGDIDELSRLVSPTR